MKRIPRRTFTTEFKAEAVRPTTEHKISSTPKSTESWMPARSPFAPRLRNNRKERLRPVGC
jgi:hypothetical protein